MGDSGLVLVTGATGYVATHCIKTLQERGWRVRGTVRNLNQNLKDERKTSALRRIVPNAEHELELVQADLLKPETWPAAVEGCKYVLHVASPFPGSEESVRDIENDLLRPAIEGTMNVLRACAKSGTVKRVVLTSSVAAVFFGTRHRGEPRKYNEDDWTDADEPRCDGYLVSKTRAEQEAWKFVRQLADAEKFELCSICPSQVIGPPLTEFHTEATSLEIIKRLMNRDLLTSTGLPHYMFPLCDVRDVAEAHVRAILSPDAPGQRFIVHTESLWYMDISRILEKNFGKYGYKFPWITLPRVTVWFGRFLDPAVKGVVYPRLGLYLDYDNSKLERVLGITPRKIEDSIVDMARALVKLGYCRRLRKFPTDGESLEKD